MRYLVVHTTSYGYSDPVPLCQNEVHLAPRDTHRQHLLAQRLSISPTPQRIDTALDYFGNHVHWFMIQDRHSELAVTATSEVEIAPPNEIVAESTPPWESVREAARQLDALSALQYVFDSPHIAAAPALADYARESFPPERPWMEAVLDLCARIFHDFKYDPTATNVSTPLDQVLEMRRGVCQDFAHLQIGCLRSLGLPARYVSGYLLTQPPPGQPRLVGADASHAWLAAWCPGVDWVELDPTNNVVPRLDHITVGWGRDYSDVCPIKGVFIGGGEHKMHVSVDVQALTNGDVATD